MSRKTGSMGGLDLTGRLMRSGLTALRLAASNPVVERYGLRPTLQKVIFEGTRRGYGAVTNLASQGPKKQKSSVALERPKTPTLFDVSPTDEQQMMLEMLERFREDLLLQAARSADDQSALPAEIVEAWNELGMAEMLIPEAYGGVADERSSISVALVIEALSRGDAGMAFGLLAPLSVALLLLDHGTDAQREQYLPGFVGDSRTVASFAMSEAEVLFDPRKLTTRAERVQGGWLLQGRKTLVARASEASFFVVAAATAQGAALFLVDADATGVEVIEEPAMGLRSANVGDLSLTAVRVSDDALLGGEVSKSMYLDVLERSRTAWAAVSCGVAEETTEFVANYANERFAFGEPISHRQAVAFLIADMAIEKEAMRLMMLRAASRLEHKMEAAEAVSQARRLAVEKGMYIGTSGVQILGGHGFVKEYLMELWYRNLRGAGIVEGGLYL